MKTIRNKTHAPIRVNFSGGKVLHLGPLKSGQVPDQALETASGDLNSTVIFKGPIKDPGIELQDMEASHLKLRGRVGTDSGFDYFGIARRRLRQVGGYNPGSRLLGV